MRGVNIPTYNEKSLHEQYKNDSFSVRLSIVSGVVGGDLEL
jgi:hypothetical protein